MNKDTSNNITIRGALTIKDALKKLDKNAENVLAVVDHNDVIIGTISDGDIRRHLLKGKKINAKIMSAYQSRFTSLKQSEYSATKAKKIMVEKRIKLIPIVNDEGTVVDYITWDIIMANSTNKPKKVNKLHIPVVIMAGGKGSRLDPITRIIPKPLIPIGEKPVIEIIIDEFRAQGLDDYHIIVNYKAEMIEAYFNSVPKKFAVLFYREKEFRGTAGGLSLLKKIQSNTCIVSNCDIIVKADYKDVLKFHSENNAYLTILSSYQHFRIPYGVVDFSSGGIVKKILEKPEHTYAINTGVYILDKKALCLIPHDKHYDMTDLISELISQSKKVLVYPVNSSDYTDIGQWDEYQKTIGKFKNLYV